jgi:hypothetical protein
VHELFLNVDANTILEIPIAPSGMKDFVAWHIRKLVYLRSEQPTTRSGNTSLVDTTQM